MSHAVMLRSWQSNPLSLIWYSIPPHPQQQDLWPSGFDNFHSNSVFVRRILYTRRVTRIALGVFVLTVISDSSDTLEQCFSNCAPDHPIATELPIKVSHLHRAGRSIVRCWVPGHSGLPGNKGADAAANAALYTDPFA